MSRRKIKLSQNSISIDVMIQWRLNL